MSLIPPTGFFQISDVSVCGPATFRDEREQNKLIDTDSNNVVRILESNPQENIWSQGVQVLRETITPKNPFRFSLLLLPVFPQKFLAATSSLAWEYHSGLIDGLLKFVGD